MTLERRPILIGAAALTIFWIATLIVATATSGKSGGAESSVISVVATLVFFFFALPALAFAAINQWLVFAAILAGIALVIDMGVVFFWILN
jgi:hypothetical protein